MFEFLCFVDYFKIVEYFDGQLYYLKSRVVITHNKNNILNYAVYTAKKIFCHVRYVDHTQSSHWPIVGLPSSNYCYLLINV